MDTGILPIADRATIAPPQSVDSRTADAPSSSNANYAAASYSTPDVQVSLSQRGRQLSIEAFERETVQAAREAQEYQVENQIVEREFERNMRADNFRNDDSDSLSTTRLTNDQTLDIGTQESIRLNTAYEPRPLLDLGRYPEMETPNAFQVRDQSDARREEAAKIQQAIDTATVVPVNSSQSASVASQYNISPESALGHSISTFA